MRSKNNRLVFGILAHVDAGKTTLSESILYKCGITNEQGRVDHGDAFLDNEEFERGHGITVYSKEVDFSYDGCDFTLIDTPGHKDFIGELERVLPVLDCAILVVSGSEAITARSETLFNLLKKHEIPTIIFVNKTDVPHFSKEEFEPELKSQITKTAIDFTEENIDFEEIALTDENALEEFLEVGSLEDATIEGLIKCGKITPTVYGSALNNKGTLRLLDLLTNSCLFKKYPDDFSAFIYKISRDEKGRKLTHMKITGGILQVKDEIEDEKINEIIVSSGKNQRTVGQAEAGQCCKVVGLAKSYAGKNLGASENSDLEVSNSNIKYEIIAKNNVPRNKFLDAIEEICEEFPEVTYEEAGTDRIYLGLTGSLFGETLKEIFKKRYQIEVEFLEPRVTYFEVFKGEAEEPVYLGLPNSLPQITLEIRENNVGEAENCKVTTSCREDQLNLERQEILATTFETRLIQGDISGINGGFPLKNLVLSFKSGRGSLKQVDDGQIQEAAKMAVYRALLQGETYVIEPYIKYQVTCKDQFVGKTSVLINKMSGTIDSTQTNSDLTAYSGFLPLILSQDFAKALESATEGSCEASFGEIQYRKCHNQEEVCMKNGGNRDLVAEYFEEIWKKPEEAFMETKRGGVETGAQVSNKELSKIFEKTYASNKGSKVKRESRIIRGENHQGANYRGGTTGLNAKGKNTLIIDGYNIIYAWEELRKISESDLGAARDRLIEIMSNYAGYVGQDTIIVFDAYKQKGTTEKVEEIHGLKVVYTAYGDTADHYIEKTVYEERDKGLITVATSDRLEQMNVFGQGALRMSARELETRVREIQEKITRELSNN